MSEGIDTVELMAKVRESDLAEIARKVASGEPLAGRERDLLKEEASRLKKEPLPVFHLEGAGADGALSKLTQAELAERWGYSIRQLKNWVADGRKAKDPAPIRRPSEMSAWFARVYAPRECPERLMLAVQAFALGEEAPAAPEAAGAPVVALLERIEIAESEKGLLAMLGRLREAEATLHARYMSSVETGDVKNSNFYRAEWTKTVESLRALEKSAPKALEELGIYVRRDEVQRELAPLHKAILKAFRQRLRASRGELRRAETPMDWNAAVDVIVDGVAGMLAETQFVEPLELEAA